MYKSVDYNIVWTVTEWMNKLKNDLKISLKPNLLEDYEIIKMKNSTNLTFFDILIVMSIMVYTKHSKHCNQVFQMVFEFQFNSYSKTLNCFLVLKFKFLSNHLMHKLRQIFKFVNNLCQTPNWVQYISYLKMISEVFNHFINKRIELWVLAIVELNASPKRLLQNLFV